MLEPGVQITTLKCGIVIGSFYTCSLKTRRYVLSFYL